MNEWGLDHRRKALEEAFFARKNQESLNHLRQQQQAESIQEELKNFYGITDKNLLAKANELGLTPSTFPALFLVPLLEVAWSDHYFEAQERQVVLNAAVQLGLKADHPAHKLLEELLLKEYDPTLFDLWSAYVQILSKKMPEQEFQLWREAVLEHAHRVAEIAGGLLGIASVSQLELSALKKIERALAHHSPHQ